MIKKILILGGSGYLGNYIAQRINESKDYSVTIGDIQKPNHLESVFVNLNVLDDYAVYKYIADYDIIINCTGQITNPISTCFKINTEGINNIIKAVKVNNKKLIQISTVSVFGTTEYADEKTNINPESPYATCKSFSEYKIIDELSIKNRCILRLPNLYGENQSKGLFAYLLRSFYSDRRLVFNNDGTLLRYFLHVEDCANAIYLAVSKNLNGNFNIGSIDQFNLKELISLIEKETGITFKKVYSNNLPINNIKELISKKFDQATGFHQEKKLLDFIKRSFI